MYPIRVPSSSIPVVSSEELTAEWVKEHTEGLQALERESKAVVAAQEREELEMERRAAENPSGAAHAELLAAEQQRERLEKEKAQQQAERERAQQAQAAESEQQAQQDASQAPPPPPPLQQQQQQNPSGSGEGAGGAGDDLDMLMAQVADLEEDHQLQEMQKVATAEEGGRKGVTGANNAGGGAQPGAGQAGGTATGGNNAAPEAARPTSLFVGNLDPRTTEQDLKALFGSCGAIKRVTILRDKFSQQPKGYAYVEFEEEAALAKGLTKENQPLHGKPLKVTVKRENVPAAVRGGGPQPVGRGGGDRGFRGGRGGRGAAANDPALAMQGMMQGMMQMLQQQQGGGGYRGRGGRGRGGARGGQ